MPVRRVGVAVIHGIGGRDADFADEMVEAVRQVFHRSVPEAPRDALVFAPVHWAPVLQSAQAELTRRVQLEHELDWSGLRNVMISFVGDGIAYEPTAHDRRVYDAVHAVMARALHRLATEAGADAPLCVVAHSLGSVIASNYLYDLGKPELVSDEVRAHMTDGALERGETLAHLFTMGSPLAVWALHHEDFGRPLTVPSTALATRHPRLSGSWLNFFDRDDVIAYPLRQLNEAYATAVTEDVSVNAGGLVGRETPLSHHGYAAAPEVVGRIAATLAETWRHMGPDT
ncbi:MAG: chemotaxis protein [Longimicrobiales bacterium]